MLVDGLYSSSSLKRAFLLTFHTFATPLQLFHVMQDLFIHAQELFGIDGSFEQCQVVQSHASIAHNESVLMCLSIELFSNVALMQDLLTTIRLKICILLKEWIDDLMKLD